VFSHTLFLAKQLQDDHIVSIALFKFFPLDLVLGSDFLSETNDLDLRLLSR